MTQKAEVVVDLMMFGVRASVALAGVMLSEWGKHLDAFTSHTGLKTHRWACANGLNRIEPGPSKVQ